MKTLKKLGAIGLASLAVCALGLPALASEGNPVTRPVKVHGNMTVVVNPLTGSCQFTEWGEAIPVGRYSNTGSGVMDRTGALVAGHGTVVAANGDRIDWVIGAPNTVVYTGGTGRFHGVTGGFIATPISREPPVVNPDGTLTVELTYIGIGQITY